MKNNKMENSKIVTKEQFKNDIGPSIKAQQKRISLCHGVFDLVHPGHVIHLQQAKSLGDVLVVSITAEQYVIKGPDRPFFDDETRLNFLAALECVDYVLLSECYTVNDIIEVVKPDLYVKGNEYSDEKNDLTGKILEEKQLVEKFGGKLVFTSGKVFSSTKLLNRNSGVLSDDVISYMKELNVQYSIEDIQLYFDKIKKMKVLVVGDCWFDEYIFCDNPNVMSKDIGYVTSKIRSEFYFGGAISLASCIAEFCEDTTLLSVIGKEQYIAKKIKNDLSPKINCELFYSDTYKTSIKQRYIIKNEKREEYRKIFEVNNCYDKTEIENSNIEMLFERLEATISKYDVVFLYDSGCGVVSEKIKELIETKARYLALRCEMNGPNYDQRMLVEYNRADAFVINQIELRQIVLSANRKEKDALRKVAEHLNCNGWLTRGALGAVGVEKNLSIYNCPAFTLKVKDTAGAEDAFLCLGGLFLSSGATFDLSTFMGNIGGALAVNILGSCKKIEKINALRYASTLLNV